MMSNALIMGSGRSGTSMVAGALSGAGYYMGENLMRPTPSNPKGYFESAEIEAINEELLAPVAPRRHGGLFRGFFRHRAGNYQRWLAQVPVGTRIPCPDALAARMRLAVARQPFCLKDPRFCYTLPAWRPLPDTVFVCVFREPAATATSILKNVRDEAYLQNLRLSFRQAVKVWTLMYRHILDVHRHEGRWLFVHYNQVVRGDGLERLESFLGAKVDPAFPDKKLSSSIADQPVDSAARTTYHELCELAGHSEIAR